MATRRKNWFKQPDSILRENWTREQQLTVVLLAAHLNNRWARDGIPHHEAGRCELGKADFLRISGKSQLKVAGSLFKSLEELLSISVEIKTKTIEIDWPKFPILQEYGSRSPVSEHTSKRPVDAPTEKRRNEKRSKPSLVDPPTGKSKKPKPTPRKKPGTSAPDNLTDEQLQALAQWVSNSEPWAANWKVLHDLVAACLGHFQASGGLKADWYKTCQNWIRKERLDQSRMYQALTGLTQGAKHGEKSISDIAQELIDEVLYPDGFDPTHTEGP